MHGSPLWAKRRGTRSNSIFTPHQLVRLSRAKQQVVAARSRRTEFAVTGRSDMQPKIPLETFSKVVEAIYDCALDPTRWQDTISVVAELLQSQRCSLVVYDYASGHSKLAFQLGYAEEYWRLYESKYRRLNPVITHVQLMPVGAAATSSTLIDDHEFFESRFYQEWCKPQGLRDSICLKVLQTEKRMGLLVANRLESYSRYGDAEVQLMTLLSPHICRAITISDVLNLQIIRSEGLGATLNALASGVYITDRHGRVVFMNRAAERQVQASNALRIENNRLAPIDRWARVALATAIDQAIANEAEVPESGFTFALPGGACGSRRHYPSTGSWGAPESLWRLWCDGGDLRARPDHGATFYWRGLRKAVWSDR